MVIAINGSPKKDGNTAAALKTVCEQINNAGIDTEIITIGGETIKGCVGCGGCANVNGCVFGGIVNDVAEKLKNANGLIVGSPVYYAGINGTLKSFLDRLFYSSGALLRWKPAAAVVAVRRGGGTAAVRQIQQYFEIAEMVQTPSIYWGAIHGAAPGEAYKDVEGINMMTQLGKNFAHLVKLTKDVAPPAPAEFVRMNFVR